MAWLVSHHAVEIPCGTEISHICHNPRCVEPGHLVAEAEQINKERNHCKKQNVCTKLHDPNCIIHN